MIGARATGQACGVADVITIDIGGMSADMSVIRGGELTIKNSRDTQVALLPVLAPMLDIDTIGAGGGTERTVTDAQAVLGRFNPGRFNPGRFLGSDLKIDRGLATRAIETHLAGLASLRDFRPNGAQLSRKADKLLSAGPGASHPTKAEQGMRVLFLGGGVIGTSIAYRLAANGADVIVIARRAVAYAASGGPGGFLAVD